MGTLGTRSSNAEGLVHSDINTPDLLTLSAALHYSALNHIDRFAFEASSHGLDQDRIPRDAVNVGVWTSFSQDHLDYHQTMEAYWKAKARLAPLCQKAFLVHSSVPDTHTFASYMAPLAEVLSYGAGVQGSTWAAYDILGMTEYSTEVKLRIDHHTWQGTLPWVGTFQCENFLAALGVCYLSKSNLPQIFSALERGACFPPPGRLEWVGQSAGGNIYVDYAHTPDGLYHVLTALRRLSPRRIGVVFGCGGDRDALKRPVMGRIAQAHADWVILTSDNPRFEDPHAILKDIQKGCPDAQCIVNRAEAIYAAIQRLDKGDVVLVAGKGHEQFQWTAEGEVPFQDKQYIQSVLAQV
jgi:UDP-N-acetylmuramoyl-L-alanyl-D-glutamate--2,6-diaminopimelate ligase